MTTPSIPSHQTESFDSLYHVGDLSKEVGRRQFSYEGGELSVCLHPDVWRRIAPCVSGDTYLLTKDSNTFYRALPAGPPDEAIDWAWSAGYTKRVSGYKVSWPDPETDATRYTLTYELDHARERAQSRVGGEITELPVVALDTRGAEYWTTAFTDDPAGAGPLQIESLIPIWIAQACGYDGVWWPETLAPNEYSAPRGAILQSALDSWHYEMTDTLFNTADWKLHD